MTTEEAHHLKDQRLLLQLGDEQSPRCTRVQEVSPCGRYVYLASSEIDEQCPGWQRVEEVRVLVVLPEKGQQADPSAQGGGNEQGQGEAVEGGGQAVSVGAGVLQGGDERLQVGVEVVHHVGQVAPAVPVEECGTIFEKVRLWIRGVLHGGRKASATKPVNQEGAKP